MSDCFVTPLSVALQAPLSMGFPSQDYWSGVPFATPGDPPNQVSCIGRQILYTGPPGKVLLITMNWRVLVK